MRVLAVVVILGAVWVSGALASRRGPAAETPRATDLLRAKRLAEEVEERRRLPPPATRSGWKRGGGGWAGPGPARSGGASGERDGDALIHVAPSKPRRARTPR